MKGLTQFAFEDIIFSVGGGFLFGAVAGYAIRKLIKLAAGCFALDPRGFIKTGPALSHDDLAGPIDHLHVRLICSRRVFPASLRSATCAAETSSGLPRGR